MDKEKKMKIVKTIGIITVLVLFAFVLRAQTYNMGALSQEAKDVFTDSDGLPYFSEMDSYFHLRLVENLLNHGHIGDVIVNNSQWDNHRLSPDGTNISSYPPMIFYVTLFFYKLASLIFHDLPIKFVAYWTGAFVGSLAVIPAFFIVRRITNSYGGVVAALLVAMSPNYFSHTYAGFYDKDMLQVLLPIIMLFFFIESIRSKNPKHRIISAILLAITVAIFSISWEGYEFYPAVLVFAILLFLIVGFIFRLNIIKPIKNYPNIKSWFVDQKEVSAISIFIIVSFVGVYITTGGISGIEGAISSLTGAVNLQSAAYGAGDYPNVLVSVSEMRKPAILSGGIFGLLYVSNSGLINSIGGIIVLFASLLMIFIFTYSFWNLRGIRSKDDKKLPKSKRKMVKNIKSTKNKGFIEKFAELTITNKSIEDSKSEMLLYITTFGAWIVISLFASLTASRFIPILVIPIALTAGIFVGYLYQYIKKYTNTKNMLYMAIISSILISYSMIMVFIDTGLLYPLIILFVLILLSYLVLYQQEAILNKIKKLKGLNIKKGSFVIILISLVVVTPTITGAYYLSHSNPGTDDAFWNSMENIKLTQPKDTVIASWWDYGYLFEIAADRMTIFDGGLQSGERAYWIGKSLTTSDDKLSTAILKMLATTGDRAANTLTNYTNDKGKSAKILEEILTKSKTDAKNILTNNYNLTSNQADTIVNYSHPDNPRPVVFVTSSDMTDKAGVWSYFGSWDFEAQQGKQLSYFLPSKSAVPMTQNETGNTTEMINYQQGEGNNSIVYKTVFTQYNNGSTDIKFVASHADGTPILLQDGSEFKPTMNQQKEITIFDAKVVENGNLTVEKTLNESGDCSLIIISEGGVYQSILMNKELSNSMYTKLYFMNGAKQNSFTNIGKESGAYTVSLWKVK